MIYQIKRDITFLSEFPKCESEDEISGEINLEMFYSMPDFAGNLFTKCTINYPKITVKNKNLNFPRSLFHGDPFLPMCDPLFRRLQYAWCTSGLKKVSRILKNENRQSLQYIGLAIDLLYRSYEKLFDAPNESLEQKRDLVVFMEWHPHSHYLAIATNEDEVFIYSKNSKIILKAKAQQHVTEIAWRPLDFDIAVACSSCVYVWPIDPNMIVTRPTSKSATILPEKHVKSLAWSRNGEVLMTCNGKNFITVWDPRLKRSSVLQKIKGNINKLMWSPDGSKLIAATSSKYFHFWEPLTWNYESWNLTQDQGRLSQFVWSTDGSILLFTSSKDHCIYCLLNGDEKSFPVVDLSKVQTGNKIVGGLVKGIVWNKSNQHLAVIFEESSLIAVFYTDISYSVDINPGFYIQGLNNEKPIFVCFETNGAILTICWSSGRVQYFPIILPTESTWKRF